MRIEIWLLLFSLASLGGSPARSFSLASLGGSPAARPPACSFSLASLGGSPPRLFSLASLGGSPARSRSRLWVARPLACSRSRLWVARPLARSRSLASLGGSPARSFSPPARAHLLSRGARPFARSLPLPLSRGAPDSAAELCKGQRGTSASHPRKGFV